MARWSSEKDALVMAVSSWRLWLLQFAGNIVIFLMFVWWLRPHEASGWELLYSSVAILLTIAAALVLHGGTLDFFQIAHESSLGTLGTALRKALRHLPAIAVWAIIFFVLQGLVGKLDQYAISFPGYLRSEFPAWLRRMISEPAMDNIYSGLVWLLRWVIVPGLLLPFGLFCADRGFSGFVRFRQWWRVQRSLSYWITLLFAALIGVVAAQALMGWKLDPRTATLQAEQVSLFFRLLFAYLLGIFSWLLACSVLGRKTAHPVGNPDSEPV